MAAIEIQGLSKRFGDITAVDDLSFSTRQGAVTGFLGPNGAGKTTTLRMLLGLVIPTEGTATVDGRPYGELAEPSRHVGAVLAARVVVSPATRAQATPGRPGMERLWSPAVATGGNRWQIERPRKRLKQAKPVADGCDQLPGPQNGKEGVSGSSPEEGFAQRVGFRPVRLSRYSVISSVCVKLRLSGHVFNGHLAHAPQAT